MRRFLAAVILVAVTAVAHADEPAGQVGVRFDESTTEFGRLHLGVQVVGFQWSKPNAGPVASAAAVFELHPRLFVNARGVIPLPGLNDRDAAPLRAEGGIQLIASNKLVLEYERVTVKEKREGDTITQTYVNVPHVKRKRAGLEASVMFARGVATFQNAGVDVTTDTTALIGVVGINAMSTNGYVTTIENFGKTTSFLWTNGGLDLLYDLSRSYDIAPDDAGKKYGGRIWGESILFRKLGFASRLELGKYPGQAGWIFLISIGGGLHLL